MHWSHCNVFHSLYYIHNVLCIILYPLYSTYCIQCSLFFALYSLSFMICTTFFSFLGPYILNSLHSILWIVLFYIYCIVFYILFYMNYILCIVLNAQFLSLITLKHVLRVLQLKIGLETIVTVTYQFVLPTYPS